MLVEPHAPDRNLRCIEKIAAGLPAQLWRDWAAALLPDLRVTVVTRSTLSYGVLLTSSLVSQRHTLELLGQEVSLASVNERLWVLCGSANWYGICAALGRVSSYLLRVGAPINYQRRRRLDYSGLLPESVWQEICDTTGDGQDWTVARCFLAEKLAGGQMRRMDTLFPLVDREWLARGVREFQASVSTDCAALLDKHARRYLRQLRIREPLEWQPPLSLLDNLTRPEPRLIEVDQ